MNCNVLTILTAGLLSGPLAAAAELPKYQFLDVGTLGGTFSRGMAINARGEITGFSSITGNSAVHAFIYSNGEMIDLGTLGGDFSQGLDINNSGEVTGYSGTVIGDSSLTVHGFLYRNGAMMDLGTLGGPSSRGAAINASGRVVGFASTPGTGCTPNHAFLYENGAMIDLGTLGADIVELPTGCSQSAARGINNAGQIIGGTNTRATGYTGSHAFLYTDGVMTNLGTFGGIDSQTDDVNESGEVTGFATISGRNPFHAFVFSNGTMADLDTLGGNNSRGFAINNAGHVTGSSNTAESGVTHAFLYAEGNMVDLGTFGGMHCEGRALNNSSAVAGSAQTADGAFHAFVCVRGQLIDLGTRGGRNSESGDMNDVGQVTGYADTADGQSHAFLATPIAHLFSRLIGEATGIGPGKSLVNSVKTANEFFDADDLGATCAALDGFIRKLRKFSGIRKPLVQPILAEGLIEDALAIMTAIKCN